VRPRSEGIEFDDSPSRVQVEVVWTFLSTQATWGRWRTREIVEAQLTAAWRVAAAYDSRTGEMVGFARAVSDGFGVAYLADVFVITGLRGRGIGTDLVDFMINGGPGSNFRWLLHTSDAHGLYARLGFAAPDHTLLEKPSSLLPRTSGPPQHTDEQPLNAQKGHNFALGNDPAEPPQHD
jgi:GNAT superfamily N-acetyltransferase